MGFKIADILEVFTFNWHHEMFNKFYVIFFYITHSVLSEEDRTV
jgi:hypothetical protein